MLFARVRQFVMIAAPIMAFQLGAMAQTPTPKPKATPDDEVIKVDSRLVVVPVSVTDANGQAVLGLTAKDFRIAEDGKTAIELQNL